jgi:DNA-binding SARP family transcriptional activator
MPERDHPVPGNGRGPGSDASHDPTRGTTQSSACAHAFLRGEFQVKSTNGVDLLPRGRKARALLAYLCLADKGRATRARLASLLWDSGTDKTARSSLRQALSELRAKLDTACPNLLTIGRDHVELDLKRCWIDVLALMEPGDGLPAIAPADGPRFDLLEDLRGLAEAFDDWLDSERSHISEKIRETLEARMERAVTGEAPPERRASEARSLIAFDPTHEEASCVLMFALDEMGHPAEAIVEYNRCKNVLWRHLRMPPSRKTQLVADGIRAKAAALSAPATVQSSPVAVTTRQHLPALGPEAIIDVAPVINLTETSKYDVLAAGLGEDLITDLAMLAGPFKVTERAERAPQGENGSVRFGVKASIQVAPQGFRLNIRLVDRERDSTVWSDRYECTEAAIVEFHTSFTSRIAREIHSRLIQEEARRLQPGLDEGRSCYELLIAASERLQRQNTTQGLQEARELFLRAVGLDPTNVEALAGLGHVYHRMASQPAYSSSPLEATAWGRAAVDGALLLDPAHVYSNHVAGMICSVEGDVERAQIAFDTALSRSNYAPSRAYGGYNKIFLGSPEAGLRSIEYCIEKNPHDPSLNIYYFFAGVAEATCGNFERAQGWLRQSLARSPTYSAAQLWLAGALELASKKREAASIMSEFRRIYPDYSLDHFASQWTGRSQNALFQLRINQLVAALRGLDQRAR